MLDASERSEKSVTTRVSANKRESKTVCFRGHDSCIQNKQRRRSSTSIDVSVDMDTLLMNEVGEGTSTPKEICNNVNTMGIMNQCTSDLAFNASSDVVDLSQDNSTTSSLHPKMMAQLGTINVEDNEPDAPRRKRPHQLKNKLSRTIFHPLPCQSHTVHHHVPQIQSITTPTIANITPMHPRNVGRLPLNGQSRKSAYSGVMLPNDTARPNAI